MVIKSMFSVMNCVTDNTELSASPAVELEQIF